MTREEKELLLKDLCARLPYEVKGRVYAEVTKLEYDITGDLIFFDSPFDVILDAINTSTEEIHVIAIGNEDTVDFIEDQQIDGKPYIIDELKPYLRPLSSMTEEEEEEYDTFFNTDYGYMDASKVFDVSDWMYAHHFDYRGLILMGLALEAPKEMYNIKSK